MLIHLDGELVHSPELWGIYDSHPLAKKKSQDRVQAAKREAFIYLHFNFFDMVYSFYVNTLHPNKIDKEKCDALQNYIRQFLSHSSQARAIFREPRTQEIYPKRFVSFMNDLIADIDNKNG